MLQHYEESYKIFIEALTLDPLNAELWYNHGLACRYTTRPDQAMHDFECAVELTRTEPSELAQKFVLELEKSSRDLENAIQEQAEPITQDQFIEREELFMQAMSLMRQSEWYEAEQTFLHLIEIGGSLPQYWGNLGVSLIMQTRYEEAEAALKRAIDIDPGYTLARNNLENLPQVRRAGGPQGIELRDLSHRQDIKQSITFYQPKEGNSSPSALTTIEQIGNTVKGTRTPVGK